MRATTRFRRVAAPMIAALSVSTCAACSSGVTAHATVVAGIAARHARSASRASAAATGDARGRRTGSRARVEEVGSTQGHLRRAAGGEVLLDGPTDSAEATRPVAGSSPSAWQPDTALPAAESGGRHVDVFYTPHPDDETLSMGVLIAAATRRGDRVVVVSLTDGRTTGAIRPIDARLAPHGLSEDGIAAARVGELRRATADLGVAASDVFLAHLDGASTDGGSIVTVAEAEAVMRVFAARFPGATHLTMSDVAERQQDHLDAGVALRRLVDERVVTDAAWTVSRLWWSLPSPTWMWVLPTSADALRVRRAALEYQTWNPEAGEYAVGFYSVRWQFAALALDVRDRTHGTGPATADRRAG